MRVIEILAKPEYLTCYNIDAGKAGEHLETVLSIRLSKALYGDYVYCLRFCTESQAKKGGMSVTGRLKQKDGIIRFALPSLLTEEGELRVQLLVYREGERIASPTLKGSLWVKKGEALPPVTKSALIMENSDNAPIFSFSDMGEFSKKNRCVLNYINTHEGIPPCSGILCENMEECHGNRYGQHYIL